MTQMNAKLWSRIPLEIVEQMLSFLPKPVLCKFQTVCKKWNLHIYEPEFGTLCTENSGQDACFIVTHWATRSRSGFGIKRHCFFDTF
jgi:hypothetical protein